MKDPMPAFKDTAQQWISFKQYSFLKYWLIVAWDTDAMGTQRWTHHLCTTAILGGRLLSEKINKRDSLAAVILPFWMKQSPELP